MIQMNKLEVNKKFLRGNLSDVSISIGLYKSVNFYLMRRKTNVDQFERRNRYSPCHFNVELLSIFGSIYVYRAIRRLHTIRVSRCTKHRGQQMVRVNLLSE